MLFFFDQETCLQCSSSFLSPSGSNSNRCVIFNFEGDNSIGISVQSLKTAAKMEYLTLPQTDIKVSRICLGCWQMNDNKANASWEAQPYEVKDFSADN